MGRQPRFVFPLPNLPLYKSNESLGTLSWDSRAPPESIVLTCRNTTGILVYVDIKFLDGDVRVYDWDTLWLLAFPYVHFEFSSSCFAANLGHIPCSSIHHQVNRPCWIVNIGYLSPWVYILGFEPLKANFSSLVACLGHLLCLNSERISLPHTHILFFAFRLETAMLTLKSTLGEVQLLIDGNLAGVYWPFPIIFTGGIGRISI